MTHQAATARKRRGAKMRNTTPTSTMSVAAVAPTSIQCGRCAAYHASGVGSGCVSK